MNTLLDRSPSRALLWLILVSAALRLAWAAGIGLGIDESYMVVAGRGPLQWGYFDHPLISWWMARGMADLVGSEAAWVVRLPFVVLFALSTWLMARLGAELASERAGFWAAMAFNLSPVFGLTSGAWVLPDGPLICALLGMALCVLRALPQAADWRWWLGAGLCAGLAMLSKYTAALPIAGLGLYLLACREHRFWLARPQPYVAAALAALVFSPTILWNIDHAWASLAFQGGRAAAARLNVLGPLVTLGGEAGVVLPWIWLGLMIVLWRGLRAGDAQARVLCAMALPPIVLFVLVSLWSRQVLYHWAAAGYVMLFPLLGVWLAKRAWTARAAQVTAGLLIVAVGLTISEVRLSWLPLVPPEALLQARDWSELRAALKPYGLPVAGTSWAETGKIGIGLGPDIAVFCRNVDAREFRFSTTPPRTGDVLIVARKFSLAQMQTVLGGDFASIEALPSVRVGEIEMAVYLGRGVKNWP